MIWCGITFGGHRRGTLTAEEAIRTIVETEYVAARRGRNARRVLDVCLEGCMQKLMFGALSVMLTAGVAYAQAPNRAAIEKQIIANESAINSAFAKNDAATFKKMVDPAGMGIDATGIVTLEGYIKQMGQMKVESWKIDNSRFLWVNNDTAVHTYTWTGKGTYMGEPVPSPTYASTLWVNRGGTWMPVFHQETMAAPTAPPKK